MIVQLRKEIRTLLPAALAATLVPVAIQYCLGPTHYRANDSIPIFILLVTLVAACSFAFELRDGTLGMLLAQPVKRRSIWDFKSAVLGGMLILVFAAYAPSTNLRLRDYPQLFLPVVFAFGLTPWLTLRLRDGLIAVVVTLAAEWSILALALQILRWRTLLPDERHLAGYRYAAVAFTTILSSVAGWLAGRRALVGWQITPTRKWNFFNFTLVWHVRKGAETRRASGALNSLFRKELRLHSMNFAIAAIGWLPFIGFLAYSGPRQDLLTGWFKYYSFVFPVFVGSAAFASERELGVLDSQRLFPFSLRWQWTFKLIICLSISMLCGALIPYALLCARTMFHPHTDHHWFKLFNYSTEIFLFTILAILGSAFVRGMLRSVIVGIGLGFASVIFLEGMIHFFTMVPWAREVIYRLPVENRLLINVYTLLGIAIAAALLILLPTWDHFSRSGNRSKPIALTLRTLSLLSVHRFAILIFPFVSHWR